MLFSTSNDILSYLETVSFIIICDSMATFIKRKRKRLFTTHSTWILVLNALRNDKWSPSLSVVLSVQMMGHLMMDDRTVLSHIEHWDLITDVLTFGLRCKDLLREGPHRVIGLCQVPQRHIVLSRQEIHFAPKILSLT